MKRLTQEQAEAVARFGDVAGLPVLLPCDLDDAPETVEEARLRVVRTEILYSEGDGS